MSSCKGRVLIVDDEPNALRVLSPILSDEGYEVLESGDARKAIEYIRTKNIDAIITDLKMPDTDGMQLFDHVTERHPDIPLIFLTAYGTVDSAVQAITQGAFYYFIKPPDYAKLKSILSRAVEQHRLKKELEHLKKRLTEVNYQHLIGTTTAMLTIFKTIESVKDSLSSILICGETGTGKELIARALHYTSTRKNSPFVAVNCAAIPRELMESELFGYERGAFTGALTRRVGRFEEATDGTIFLDEIGELELPLQAKLLRVLQEKEIERLGSNKRIKANFRLISSTNRDLAKNVAEGSFREDLFYRVNVVQLTMPALRDRREDIPALVTEFVKEFCIRENKIITIADEVMQVFMSYPWPGNIRQLKNVVERAVVLTKGDIVTTRDIPEELLSYGRKRPEPLHSIKPLRHLESEAIRETLKKCNGNKSKAAKLLGVSRKCLYKKLKDSHSTVVPKRNKSPLQTY